MKSSTSQFSNVLPHNLNPSRLYRSPVSISTDTRAMHKVKVQKATHATDLYLSESTLANSLLLPPVATQTNLKRSSFSSTAVEPDTKQAQATGQSFYAADDVPLNVRAGGDALAPTVSIINATREDLDGGERSIDTTSGSFTLDRSAHGRVSAALNMKSGHTWIPFGALKEVEIAAHAKLERDNDPNHIQDIIEVRSLDGQLAKNMDASRKRGHDTSHVVARMREQQWLQYRQVMNKYRSDKHELNENFARVKVHQACSEVRDMLAQVDSELDALLVEEGALDAIPLPPEGRVSAAAKAALESLENRTSTLEAQLSHAEAHLEQAMQKLKLHEETLSNIQKQTMQQNELLSSVQQVTSRRSQGNQLASPNSSATTGLSSMTGTASRGPIAEIEAPLEANLLSNEEKESLEKSVLHYSNCRKAWRPILERAQERINAMQKDLEDRLKEESNDMELISSSYKLSTHVKKFIGPHHSQEGVYRELLNRRTALVAELSLRLRSLEAERVAQMLRLISVTEVRLKQTHYDDPDQMGRSIFADFLGEEKAELKLTQLQNQSSYSALLTRLESDALQRAAWTNYSRARAVERFEIEKTRSLFLGVLRFAMSPAWLLPESRGKLFSMLSDTIVRTRANVTRAVTQMLSLNPKFESKIDNIKNRSRVSEFEGGINNIDSTLLNPGPNSMSDFEDQNSFVNNCSSNGNNSQGRAFTFGAKSRTVTEGSALSKRRQSFSSVFAASSQSVFEDRSDQMQFKYVPTERLTRYISSWFAGLTEQHKSYEVDVVCHDIFENISAKIANSKSSFLEFEGAEMSLCATDVSAILAEIIRVCEAADKDAHSILRALFEIEDRRKSMSTFILNELKAELMEIRDSANSPKAQEGSSRVLDAVDFKLAPLFQSEHDMCHVFLTNICSQADEEIELFANQSDALGRFGLALASAWESALVSVEQCESHFSEALCLTHDLYAERLFELLKVTEAHVVAASEADSLESLQREVGTLHKLLVSVDESHGTSLWEATHRLWASRVERLSDQHVQSITSLGLRSLAYIGQLLGLRALPMHESLLEDSRASTDISDLRLDYARRDAELEGLVRLQVVNNSQSTSQSNSASARRAARVGGASGGAANRSSAHNIIRTESATLSSPLPSNPDEIDIAAELVALGVKDSQSPLPPLPSLDSIRNLGLMEQLVRVRALRAILLRHVENRIASMKSLVKDKPLVRVLLDSFKSIYSGKQPLNSDGADEITEVSESDRDSFIYREISNNVKGTENVAESENSPQIGDTSMQSNVSSGFDRMDFYQIEVPDATVSRMLGLSKAEIKEHLAFRANIYEIIQKVKLRKIEKQERKRELKRLSDAIEVANKEIKRIEGDIAALPSQTQIGTKFAVLQRQRTAATQALSNAVSAHAEAAASFAVVDQEQMKEDEALFCGLDKTDKRFLSWLGEWCIKVQSPHSKIVDDGDFEATLELASRASAEITFRPNCFVREALEKGSELNLMTLSDVAMRAFIVGFDSGATPAKETIEVENIGEIGASESNLEDPNRQNNEELDDDRKRTPIQSIPLEQILMHIFMESPELSVTSLEDSAVPNQHLSEVLSTKQAETLVNTFTQPQVPSLFHSRKHLIELLSPMREQILTQLLNLIRKAYVHAKELHERRISVSQAVLVGALEQLRPAMTWVTRHVTEPRYALLSKRMQALDRLNDRAAEAAQEADSEMERLCESVIKRVESWSAREAEEERLLVAAKSRAELSKTHIRLRSEMAQFEGDIRLTLNTIRDNLEKVQSHIISIGDSFLKTCFVFEPKFPLTVRDSDGQRKILLDNPGQFLMIESSLVPKEVDLVLNNSRLLSYSPEQFKHIFPSFEKSLPIIPRVQLPQQTSSATSEQSSNDYVLVNRSDQTNKASVVGTLVPFGITLSEFDLSNPFSSLLSKNINSSNGFTEESRGLSESFPQRVHREKSMTIASSTIGSGIGGSPMHPNELLRSNSYVKGTVERTAGALNQLYSRRLKELENLLQMRIASINKGRNEVVKAQSAELARIQGCGKMFGPARRTLDASVKQLLAHDYNEEKAMDILIAELSDLLKLEKHDEDGHTLIDSHLSSQSEEGTCDKSQTLTLKNTKEQIDQSIAIAASNSSVGLANYIAQRLVGPAKLLQPKPRLKPTLAESLKRKSSNATGTSSSVTKHVVAQILSPSLETNDTIDIERMREAILIRDLVSTYSAYQAAHLLEKSEELFPPKLPASVDLVESKSTKQVAQQEQAAADAAALLLNEKRVEVVEDFLCKVEQALLGKDTSTAVSVQRELVDFQHQLISSCGVDLHAKSVTGSLGLPIIMNGQKLFCPFSEEKVKVGSIAYGFVDDYNTDVSFGNYARSTHSRILTLLSAVRSLSEARTLRLQLNKEAVRSDEALRPLLSRFGDLRNVDVSPLAEFMLATSLIETTKVHVLGESKKQTNLLDSDDEDNDNSNENSLEDRPVNGKEYQYALGPIPGRNHPIASAFLVGAVAICTGTSRFTPSQLLRTALGHVRALSTFAVQKRVGASENLSQVMTAVSVGLTDLQQNRAASPRVVSQQNSRESNGNPHNSLNSPSRISESRYQSAQHNQAHPDAAQQIPRAKIPLASPCDCQASADFVKKSLNQKDNIATQQSHIASPQSQLSGLSAGSHSRAALGGVGGVFSSSNASAIHPPPAADPVLQRICLSMAFVNAQIRQLVSGTAFGYLPHETSTAMQPKDGSIEYTLSTAVEIPIMHSKKLMNQQQVIETKNQNDLSNSGVLANRERNSVSRSSINEIAYISRAGASVATSQIASLLSIITRLILLLIPGKESVQISLHDSLRSLRASALTALTVISHLMTGRVPAIPLLVKTVGLPIALQVHTSDPRSLRSSQDLINLNSKLLEGLAKQMKSSQSDPELQYRLAARFSQGNKKIGLADSLSSVVVEFPAPKIVGAQTVTLQQQALKQKIDSLTNSPSLDVMIELATTPILQNESQGDNASGVSSKDSTSADSIDFESVFHPTLDWRGFEVNLSLQEDILGSLIYFKADMVTRLACHRLQMKSKIGDTSPENVLEDASSDFLVFGLQMAEVALDKLFHARRRFSDQVSTLHDILPQLLSLAYVDLKKTCSQEAKCARIALAAALDDGWSKSAHEADKLSKLASQLIARNGDKTPESSVNLSVLDSMQESRSREMLKLANTFRTSALLVELIFMRSVFQRTIHLSSALASLGDSLIHPSDLIQVPSNPGPITIKVSRPVSAAKAEPNSKAVQSPNGPKHAKSNLADGPEYDLSNVSSTTGAKVSNRDVPSLSFTSPLELPSIRSARGSGKVKESVVARNPFKLKLLQSRKGMVPGGGKNSQSNMDQRSVTNTGLLQPLSSPSGNAAASRSGSLSGSGHPASITPLSGGVRGPGMGSSSTAAAAAAAALQAAKESAQAAFQSALTQSSAPLSFIATLETTLGEIKGDNASLTEASPVESGHSSVRLLTALFPGVDLTPFRIPADKGALRILLRGLDRGNLTSATTNTLLRDIEMASCPVTQLLAHFLLAAPGRVQSVVQAAREYTNDSQVYLSVDSLVDGKAESIEVATPATLAYRSALSRLIFTERDSILRKYAQEHLSRVSEIEKITQRIRDREADHLQQWAAETAPLRRTV